MASTQNLASGVLASSISSSATTISVNSGSGSATTLQGVWPDPPFYATIMPANPTAGVSNSLDSEVVLITAVTGTSDGSTVTMTAERGEKGTTAKAFSEGAIITNGIYAETGVFTAVKSANAYSITDVRAPMPAEGVEIFVQFDTAHTTATAPTLSINGYGSGTIKLFGPTYGKASSGVGAQIATGFVYHLVYTTVGGTAIWQVLNVHNLVQTDDIASSAVTSAKIASSAVTSDKIDFTTLKLLSGMPVAKYTQAMGYGGTIPLYRIGNFVFMNGSINQSIDPGEAGTWSSLTEAIKSGYRPIWEFRLSATGWDNYVYAPRCWDIYPSGEMAFISLRSGTGKAFQVNCCWITRDAFPDSDII